MKARKGMWLLGIAMLLGCLGLPQVIAAGDDEDEMTEKEKESYKQAIQYVPEVKDIARFLRRNWFDRPQRQEKLRRLREIETHAYPALVHLYKKEGWTEALEAMVFLKDGRQFIKKQLRKKKKRSEALGTPIGGLIRNHEPRDVLKEFLPEYLDLLREIKERDRQVNKKEAEEKGEGKKEGHDKREWILQVASGIITDVAYIGDPAALPVLKELEEEAYDEDIRSDTKRARLKITAINTPDKDDRVTLLMNIYEGKEKFGEKWGMQGWAENMLMLEPNKAMIIAYFRRRLKEYQRKPDNERVGHTEFTWLDLIEELGGELSEAEKKYMDEARLEARINFTKSDFWHVTLLAPKE